MPNTTNLALRKPADDMLVSDTPLHIGNLADDVDAIGAPWASWVPVWAASSGTAPAIGDGVLSGRVKKIGRTVLFYARITWGTTTTGGTGPWTLSLPYAAANPVIFPIFAATADATFNLVQGMAYTASGSTLALYGMNAGGATPGDLSGWTNATVTMSKAANSFLHLQGAYQAAA